jgi:putative NADH-flavin reductase
MLKIVLFGTGGEVGSAVAVEAAARGHRVTRLRSADSDITDALAVAKVAVGHDVAIVAVAPSNRDPDEFYRLASSGLVAGLRAAGIRRLVWVSIASLLPDANGRPLVEAEGFPAEYVQFSLAHRVALDEFTRSDLLWTAVSPAGDFDRNGSSHANYVLTSVGDVEARITYPDHARAIVDLAERPGEHVGEHVGVLPLSSNRQQVPARGDRF